MKAAKIIANVFQPQKVKPAQKSAHDLSAHPRYEYRPFPLNSES